jgi:hypothetical protein
MRPWLRAHGHTLTVLPCRRREYISILFGSELRWCMRYCLHTVCVAYTARRSVIGREPPDSLLQLFVTTI